tara:strand:+ start:6972 stop:7562 length:591 start_codon:yes stop_codon:yes gene_type:complete
LLERWLLAHSKNPGPDVVDRVLDAIEEEELGRWSVAKNSWIELGSDFLSMVVGTAEGMEPNWAPIRWGGSTQLYLPDRSVLCRRVLPGERNLFSAIKAGEVDVKTAAFLRIPGDASEVLEVRRWQPGDKFQPLGAPGRKKLQDCFTDRKISPEQRRTLPVICWRGKICWVPGLPPAEEFRVTSAEESLLSLTYLQS